MTLYEPWILYKVFHSIILHVFTPSTPRSESYLHRKEMPVRWLVRIDNCINMKLGWFDSHCSGNKPPSSPPSLPLPLLGEEQDQTQESGVNQVYCIRPHSFLFELWEYKSDYQWCVLNADKFTTITNIILSSLLNNTFFLRFVYLHPKIF